MRYPVPVRLSHATRAPPPDAERAGTPRFGPIDRLLLAIVLVVYAFSAKGHIQVSDTTFSVRTAEAILTSGRLEIAPEGRYTFTASDGRSYSKYGIGLPLYLLPLVAAGRGSAAIAGLPPAEVIGFLISFASIPFSLLSLILLNLLLQRLGVAVNSAQWLMVALGLGTLCWRYACYDVSEAMQMGLLLLAAYGVIRGDTRHVTAGGLGFAGLVLVKVVYAAFLPVFLAFLLAPPPRGGTRTGRAALFASPVLLALCTIAILNHARFASILETGYGEEAYEFSLAQLWYAIPSLFFTLDNGLFVFCPVAILGVLGCRAFVRRCPREGALCGAIVALNLIIAGTWHSWEGRWVWGPRFLVPAIPFWLLPIAFWLGPRPTRARFATAGAVTLFSMLLQIPGILVKDQEIHHIRYVMLTPWEQKSFPPDSVAVYVLLWHKLSQGDEVYHASEFGIPGDRQLDVSFAQSFAGLNLWTEHAARRFHAPGLRWLPALGLLVSGCLALRVRSLYARGRRSVSTFNLPVYRSAREVRRRAG